MGFLKSMVRMKGLHSLSKTVGLEFESPCPCHFKKCGQ